MGDMRISYAKFLQLLEADRVKRVVVYGDMKTAVVEVRVGLVCIWVGGCAKSKTCGMVESICEGYTAGIFSLCQ